MYNRTFFVDHVFDEKGNVVQQGTLLDQETFNKTELALFETVATLGTMFQNLQLQKDDIEKNYEELLRQKELIEKQSQAKGLKIFITSVEKTIDNETAFTNTTSTTATMFFDFEGDEIMESEDYYVMPFVTSFEQKTNLEDCVDFYYPPIFEVYKKEKNKCMISAFRMDSKTRIKSYTVRCLVIGGA